jgi:hypothetical protein
LPTADADARHKRGAPPPDGVAGSAPSAGWKDVGVSEQPGRYQRSFAGMVAAMLVIVVIVAGYALVRGIFYSTDTPDPAQPVDFQQPAHYARRTADFHLLAPRSLPPGWIATSVRFTPGQDQAWHLGTLTGDRK